MTTDPLFTLLEGVFESLPHGLVIFDDTLRASHRNAQARWLIPDASDIAVALADGAHDHTEKEWRELLQQSLADGRAHRFAPCEFRTTAGQVRLITFTCIPCDATADDSQRTGFLLAEDATENRSLEKRLAVTERYAAVGKLAARVAHELNNPLDGILRYINLAIRLLAPHGQDRPAQYLNEARRGLMRMAGIISDLLEYSRSPQTANDDGNVNEIIEDAVKTMNDKIQSRQVVVVYSFGDRMPRLAGTGLFQVCCNLVKNAVDAMPNGGRLMITTRRFTGGVLLMFEDTGDGLPEDAQRVFEPFFTTKAPGEGTGLGLAICRDFIADKYHGTIEAENRPEGGARFVIRIPDPPATQVNPTDTHASSTKKATRKPSPQNAGRS